MREIDVDACTVFFFFFPSLLAYLRVLVVEGMEVGGGYVLLGKCPDGGQSLQCGGDVGVHWTASCRGDGALSVYIHLKRERP